MPTRLAVLLAMAVVAALVPAAPASADATWPTTGAADYQLGGAYTPPARVTIVSRDSGDEPAPGLYSICYVNGFQTQPEDRGRWLTKHAGLVLRRGGEPVIDPNWPDEFLLDTSTAAKREAIARIIGRTIERCAAKGFDAVEIDNLDSFARSHGLLTASDNRRTVARLARIAHRRGLAIGQKNTAEYAARWKPRVGFDFAVAEQCARYRECALYTSAYGDHVIDIEYTDDPRGTFANVCASPDRPRFTILRDRDLVPRGHADYAYSSC